MMLYSCCTHMATVGVKGLSCSGERGSRSRPQINSVL